MSEERLVFSQAEASSLTVQALCREILRGGVSVDIHADDEMLKFFFYSLGYSREQAAAVYLDSGARIWGTLRQVMEWRFGSPLPALRLLDFASGYGRVTRHIVVDVPADGVWVADIYAEGVAFQERRFGVHGLRSSTDPAAFQPPAAFDCILVSSLFTHLPGVRFGAWLRRLGELLAPGGLLLFSVHDLGLRSAVGGVAAPESGIAFEASSESGSLAADEYGSSWVSESYVRAAVKEAMGDRPLLRLPRGLANFQDLYVVLADATPVIAANTASAAPSPLAGLRVRRSLDGAVEHVSRRGRHGLHLAGWVADRLTGQPPREIQLWVDGLPLGATRALERRAMPPFVADPLDAVGWQLTVELPPAADADGAALRVAAVASDGEDIDLYSGTLAGALLRSAQFDLVTTHARLQQETAAHEQALAAAAAKIESLEAAVAGLRHRGDELSQRIRAMEASRFWKLRNRWFRLKALAGRGA